MLLEMVDNQDMTEEEVGQRILTALKQVGLKHSSNTLNLCHLSGSN